MWVCAVAWRRRGVKEGREGFGEGPGTCKESLGRPSFVFFSEGIW